MTDLFAARSQMAISLGFHIIFAAIGIAMPFFMAISHWRWLKTKEPVYLDLTKAWSKGVAIFFATGSGLGHGSIVRTGATLAQIRRREFSWPLR